MKGTELDQVRVLKGLKWPQDVTAVASRRQWLDTEVRTQARLAASASSDQSQTNNQEQLLLTQGVD